MRDKDLTKRFKDRLRKLSDTLGEDNAEGLELLTAIKRDANEVLSELSLANEESATRKESIRKLEAKIEAIPDTSSTLSEKEAEIERLKTFEEKWNTSLAEKIKKNAETWAEKAKRLEVEETDPKFEKINAIKESFFLKDELTPEEIASNIQKMGLLEKAGVFEVDNGGTVFKNEKAILDPKRNYKDPLDVLPK